MRWTRGYRSDQVEDRRAEGGSSGGGISRGSVGILFWLFQRFGLPGVLIGGAALYFAGAFGNGSGSSLSASGGSNSAADDAAEQPVVEFVSFVLDDVQNTWKAEFAARQKQYELASMVLFRGQTRSGCGTGAAEMGPFYCSRDRKVYIDLSFYEELKQRFGAPGDFAQAYVIAHEVGHHVQNLLGTSARVQEAPSDQQEGANGLSVRLELQADCYAGVWGRATEQRKILEAGDIEEALRAASAIGDDRLQKQASGTVTPETFTHGTSEQRQRWFKRGFDSGRLEDCDTFGTRAL
jgi:predicted metalloprotease